MILTARVLYRATSCLLAILDLDRRHSSARLRSVCMNPFHFQIKTEKRDRSPLIAILEFSLKCKDQRMICEINKKYCNQVFEPFCPIAFNEHCKESCAIRILIWFS